MYKAGLLTKWLVSFAEAYSFQAVRPGRSNVGGPIRAVQPGGLIRTGRSGPPLGGMSAAQGMRRVAGNCLIVRMQFSPGRLKQAERRGRLQPTTRFAHAPGRRDCGRQGHTAGTAKAVLNVRCYVECVTLASRG